MAVGGIETTIPLFQDLMVEPDILEGRYHSHQAGRGAAWKGVR